MDNIMEQAAAKLQKELKTVKQPYMEKPIVEYLCGHLDDALATNIIIDHKSLKKCIDYITAVARKRLKSKSGALPDQEVFDMAVAYFNRDDAEEERKKKAADANRKIGEEERKRKAEADRDAQRKARYEASEPPKKKDSQLSLFDLMGAPNE